jgi:hypothetical protein
VFDYVFDFRSKQVLIGAFKSAHYYSHSRFAPVFVNGSIAKSFATQKVIP